MDERSREKENKGVEVAKSMYNDRGKDMIWMCEGKEMREGQEIKGGNRAYNKRTGKDGRGEIEEGGEGIKGGRSRHRRDEGRTGGA